MELAKQYSGMGDMFVDFGSNARSFADFAGGNVATAGERFSIQITNNATSAVDKVIAIVPAFFTSAAEIQTHTGRTCDVILADGTIDTTTNKEVVVTSDPKSVKSFLQYIKYNPTIIIGAKMRVDNQEQFDESFYVTRVKPTGNLQDRTIPPSVFKNSTQNNELLAEIPFNGIQFDNQTIVLLKIRDGRSLNIDFFLGASLNTAAALSRKQTLAMAGFKRAYNK
jgi:hypothetical protein